MNLENNAAPDAANVEGQELNTFNGNDTPETALASSVVDYAWIKAQAKARKCTVKSIVALAPKNDPFYNGTPSDIASANWFRDIWARAGFQTAHLRRVHYWCVSQGDLLRHDGLPYENTDGCWDYLCTASKNARYLGTVPVENVMDNKSPDPHIHADYTSGEPTFNVDAPDLADPYIEVDGFSPERVQPFHLELLVEKSTMNDVLIPLCRKYHANLVTAEGEFSITAVRRLAARVRQADKPARIFFISDFDPAGKSIPKAVARKLEYFIQGTGFDVKLTALALTLDQVQRYSLPRVPIKESETRGAAFEATYGEGAVELDALEALHPGVLGGIVDGALAPFYSMEASRELSRKERALRQAVKAEVEAITERYADEIEALKSMTEELRGIEIFNPEEFEVKPVPPSPEADEGFNWLLDSRREYMAQIAAYRAFEGGAA